MTITLRIPKAAPKVGEAGRKIRRGAKKVLSAVNRTAHTNPIGYFIITYVAAYFALRFILTLLMLVFGQYALIGALLCLLAFMMMVGR